MAYSTGTYPYDAVVYLTTDFGQGSGAIIGPHTVLTASHMLWDQGSHQATGSVSVFPGYSNGGNTVVDNNWVAHFYKINDAHDLIPLGDSQFDFAVIDFAQDLSSFGSFGIATDFIGGRVHMTGYPDTAGGAQSDEVGTVVAERDLALLDYGSLDPHPGSSGGPLWFDRTPALRPQPGAPATDPAIVGVVSSAGGAVQLTGADLDTIQGWEQADSFLWLNPGSSPPSHTAGSDLPSSTGIAQGQAQGFAGDSSQAAFGFSDIAFDPGAVVANGGDIFAAFLDPHASGGGLPLALMQHAVNPALAASTVSS